MVQLKDVDELMSDDELHPVVEVGECGPLHRRTDINDYPVVGNRRCEAVARLGVVRQEELDVPTRRIQEDLSERIERLLRPGRRPSRQRVHALRKRDPEVAGLEASPRLVRRHLGGDRRSAARPGGHREAQQDQNVSTHLSSLTLSNGHIILTL